MISLKVFDRCTFSFAGKPLGLLTDLNYTTTKTAIDIPAGIPDESVLITLPPGCEPKLVLPPLPPEDFLAAVQTAISTVAACLGLPMNLATTSQGCNFSNARADAKQWRRKLRNPITTGMPIVPCDWMADRVWTQVRFPRSKKNRIRNKWRKDNRNFLIVETPWPAYIANGTLFCHTRTYLAIKRQLMMDGEVFVAGNRIIDPLRITPSLGGQP